MNNTEKKLRVGFDARWHNDSGVGRYVAELLPALERTQQVELVVYEDEYAPVAGLDRSPVERIFVSGGRYSLPAQIELARRIRRDELDVFHSPFYPVPLAASCPVVVTIHDLIPFLFPIYGPVKSAMVKTGYRMAARKAAQIIAVSQNTASDVQKILNVDADKVTAVHNAAAAVFQPRAQESELEALQQKYGVSPPYVVAASAHNWRTKNLEGALQALAAAQIWAQFQTVVYGPEEGLRAAGPPHRAKSGRGGDADPPRSIGPVQAGELAALFRHARAFIFPSLYEGFGLPAVEAMACGCPVVASNGGSLAEVAGGGAQVFDPADAKGMAAAIAELVRNEECACRWRQAALRRAGDFSWERAARDTVAVYHRSCRECEQSKSVAGGS